MVDALFIITSLCRIHTIFNLIFRFKTLPSEALWVGNRPKVLRQNLSDDSVKEEDTGESNYTQISKVQTIQSSRPSNLIRATGSKVQGVPGCTPPVIHSKDDHSQQQSLTARYTNSPHPQTETDISELCFLFTAAFLLLLQPTTNICASISG